MIRKLVCSVAILGLSLGLALAEEVKGRITKIDDSKVTVVTGRKKDNDQKTTDYDLAKNCKFNKTENKAKVDLTGGAKADVFQNLDKKGVPATLNVVDGKVTEITVGGRKKKTNN